jgi:hypothetical protein
MPKECAAIATINMEGQRNPGTALTINYMPTECVKTATSTLTIANGDKREQRRKTKRVKCQVS